MSRKLFKILLPVAALGGIIVGSTIAWSNSAGPSGGMASVTQPSVTQAAAPVINADPVKVDINQAFTDVTALPSERAPFKVDFHQAFADAAAIPQRINTPSNREKLRDAGWAQIIGPR